MALEDRPRTARICASLFLAALLLRLPGLDGGLWFDEVWMLVDFVRAPLGKVLSSYPTDNHHPLYTLLAWGSARAFGQEPWSLRLPALLFGAASVAALYPFAARITSARTALLACALLAASPHHVFFSQNARGYTAMLFFALVASQAFHARRPLLQGVALSLSIFAHLTGAFVAVGQLGAWALSRRGNRSPDRAPLVGVLIGAALSIALHAAMLPDMLRFFFLRQNPYAAKAEWSSPLWTLLEAARSFGFGLAPGLLVLAAGLAIAILGLARLWKRDREAAWIVLLPPALCAVALVALGRNLWPRSFFFAAGFMALIAAEGGLAVLDRLLPRAADALAAALVVASLALVPRQWRLPKQDFAGARDYALSARAAGEPVLTVGLATFPYQEYYGGGFTAVDSREDLERELAGGRGALVITTFPIYLRSRRPDLARALEQRGREVRRFPGSVGDGDVIVLRVR
jgi:mannosyltransferase